MTKDEALKMALKALRFARDDGYENEVSQEAITAIKQALAAPVQEPVAWIKHHKGGDNLEWDNPGGKCTPLYTTPPAAQPAPMQEHVASAAYDMVDRFLRNNLSSDDDYAEYSAALDVIYTTPPAAPVQEPVANASAWFALVMNAAAELEDASYCLRDEDAKRVAISGAKHYRDAAKALYTTPPAAQRQWVGLTDEEVIKCTPNWIGTLEDVARAIEAKLKEKNTP